MSGILFQQSRPINASLDLPGQETLDGSYEYIGYSHYFFSTDKVFLCSQNDVEFTQIYPLDTSVKTPLSAIHFHLTPIPNLPDGSNYLTLKR